MEHKFRYDLRQVRAFLAVAGELHFGHAAAGLFMTQPALSRMVRKLEESVGLALFERSTRRVRLTPAGEAFAGECRLALAHLDLASRAARDAALGREGRLRVGYMDFAINGRLPQILQRFRSEAAGVSIVLEYMPTAAQHVALLEGRIDIGFLIGEFRAQNVRNALVDREEFVALLPARHRLARRGALRLADLGAEPFVIGSENTFRAFRTLLFDLCRGAGFFPNVVQEASNSDGIFGLVAAGAGVSIYAGCARNLRRKGVVVKAIADARETIPICAAWVAGHPSPALRRFREMAVAGRPK